MSSLSAKAARIRWRTFALPAAPAIPANTTSLKGGQKVCCHYESSVTPNSVLDAFQHDVLLEEVVAIGERDGAVDFAGDVDLQLALEGGIWRGERRAQTVEAIELRGTGAGIAEARVAGRVGFQLDARRMLRVEFHHRCP